MESFSLLEKSSIPPSPPFLECHILNSVWSINSKFILFI